MLLFLLFIDFSYLVINFAIERSSFFLFSFFSFPCIKNGIRGIYSMTGSDPEFEFES